MPITNKDIKIEKKEAQEFEPLPENVYQVELLDITDKESPSYNDKSIMETKLSFQFTLLGGKDKKGEVLRGRNVWKNFVPTYLYEGRKGKNTLYQIVEALLGKELNPADEATFDLDTLISLIGKQCRVVVKNKTSGDKIFSNIESFLNIDHDMPSLDEEEKEKAKVKPKEKEGKEEDNDEIETKDIPF